MGTFAPAGTALASSTTYDPWGQVIAATGPAVQIGYQGQWTDPLTGQVNMGSRFYKPAQGSFLDKDTTPSGNPYAYTGDNPVSLTDPTGHSPDGDSSSTGNITQAELDQAKANASNLYSKADRLEYQASAARNTAAQDQTALNAAADYATKMNIKAIQASITATEAQQQATNAQNVFDAWIAPFGSIQTLTAKLNAAENALWQAQIALYNLQGSVAGDALVDCVVPDGGNGCMQGGNSGSGTSMPSGLNWLAEKITEAEAAVESWKATISLYQSDLIKAQSLQSNYQELKSKADSLWKASQEATAAASAAGNAQTRAQTTYNQAAVNASQLTGQAADAEKAADTAEDNYKNLLKKYDEQRAAKRKTKPGPGPGTGPEPGPGPGPTPPEPIHPPRPISPQPGPRQPGPGPVTGPPGGTSSPSPSTGGSGQGSGSGGGGQVGECPDPEGASNPLDMVPEGASLRVLTPDPDGGAQEGVEYKWTNELGQTVRLRIHGPDGTAPAGSNAAEGTIYRVQVGGRYMDAEGNLYPRGIHNPNSPNYDPEAANATHIPWPPDLPLPWECLFRYYELAIYLACNALYLRPGIPFRDTRKGKDVCRRQQDAGHTEEATGILSRNSRHSSR